MSTTYGTTPAPDSLAQPNYRPDTVYISSLQGSLKIVEIALTLISFICSCVFPWWASSGGGWVQYATVSSFIISTFFFLVHIFNFFRSNWERYLIVIEFVGYCIAAMQLLIAGIVAATRAYFAASIGAAAFFAFMSTIAFVIDVILQVKDRQSIADSSAPLRDPHQGTP